MNSTQRKELHPKFVGCELRSFKLSWLSFAAPQEVTGRIWFLALGSNETEPTVSTIKAHSKGFSFKAGIDGALSVPLATFERSLLAAKQADHHYGGLRLAFLADITHTSTTKPAVASTEKTPGTDAVPSTQEVGILKLTANFLYDRHADV